MPALTVTDHTDYLLPSPLFQMQGPSNIFDRTGQGFTGLNYAYDPATGAEMQYSCTAS